MEERVVRDLSLFTVWHFTGVTIQDSRTVVRPALPPETERMGVNEYARILWRGRAGSREEALARALEEAA